MTSRLGIDSWARSRGGAFTAAYYTVVSTLGVIVGFVLMALAFDNRALQWILQPRWIAVMGLSSGVISIIIAVIAFSREGDQSSSSALLPSLLPS